MIICKECNTTLDSIDLSHVEYKTCMKCVRGEAPAADLNKIVDQHGEAIREVNPPSPTKQEMQKELKRFSSMELMHNYMDFDGEIRLNLSIRDYFKKEFMNIALSKEQLQDFIKDIDQVQKDLDDEETIH